MGDYGRVRVEWLSFTTKPLFNIIPKKIIGRNSNINYVSNALK